MATQVISKIRADDTEPDTYSKLSIWEDEIPLDLVTADEQWIAECYNDWPGGLIDGGVLIASKTTDATRNVVITSPEGQRHNGSVGSGFILSATTSPWQTLNIECANTYVEWIQVNQVRVSVNATAIELSQHNVVVYKCIVTTNSSTSGLGLDIAGSYNGRVASHCLSVGMDIALRATRKINVYNCVFVDGRTGFTDKATAYEKNVHNNVAYNNTDYDFYAPEAAANNFTHNASGDTTATDKDPVTSISGITSAVFKDYAGGDYHLSPTSQIIGAGLNLIENPPNLTPPQYDIDGDEWPTSGAWDIGFDYETGGAPPGETINGSGALASEKAILAGTGTVKFGILGSGNLSTQNTELVGAGTAFFAAQGAGQLEVKKALLSGAGTAFSVISGEGGLTTKLVELLGEGSAFTPTSEILGAGDLLTALTELSGSGIVLETVRGSGDLSTEQAILDGSGQVSYEPVTIEGAGQLTLLKTQLDGSGRVLETIIGTGELATALTELSGSGVLTGLVTGSGNFTVPTAVMLGTGVVNSTIIGDGDLQVQMPVLKGYGGEALVRVTEIHFTLAIKKEHVSTLSIRKEVP